ncbi:MAG TPA: hypothetical protein VGF08_01575 [Terriglobales bacterium]|jgi:hypothetical protein
MGKLEIVWRNPKAKPRMFRCHPVVQDARQSLYIVEELVWHGSESYWARRSCIEVLRRTVAVA